MSYRPITPIKGSGIAAVTELYLEQQDARHSQVVAEAGARAADPTRGRLLARAVIALVVVGLLAVVTFTALTRTAPGPAPAAVTSIAKLAGSSTATTTFDGRQYTIVFTLANPRTIYATARTFAEQHGYAFDTPTSGPIAFHLSGPQGGVALGYFDGAGEPNTAVRIVIDASDVSGDGSALR